MKKTEHRAARLRFFKQRTVIGRALMNLPNVALSPIQVSENTALKEYDIGHFILCSQCRHPITDKTESIKSRQKNQHFFSTEFKHDLEMACFREALGCSNIGNFKLDNTWFSGYSRRYSLCCSCDTHLGWFYKSVYGDSFFGLISNRLSKPHALSKQPS